MQRSEKQAAIAEFMVQHARVTLMHARALSNAAVKLPRIKSKNTTRHARLLRRRRIGLLTASLAIHKAMGAAQLAILISQPLPKFKPGGMPVTNEETILRPNNSISFE